MSVLLTAAVGVMSNHGPRSRKIPSWAKSCLVLVNDAWSSGLLKSKLAGTYIGFSLKIPLGQKVGKGKYLCHANPREFRLARCRNSKLLWYECNGVANLHQSVMLVGHVLRGPGVLKVVLDHGIMATHPYNCRRAFGECEAHASFQRGHCGRRRQVLDDFLELAQVVPQFSFSILKPARSCGNIQRS